MSFIKKFIKTKTEAATSAIRRRASDFTRSVRDIFNNPAESLSRFTRNLNPFSRFSRGTQGQDINRNRLRNDPNLNRVIDNDTPNLPSNTIINRDLTNAVRTRRLRQAEDNNRPYLNRTSHREPEEIAEAEEQEINNRPYILRAQNRELVEPGELPNYERFNENSESFEDYLTSNFTDNNNIDYDAVGDTWARFSTSPTDRNFDRLEENEQVVNHLDEADYIVFSNPTIGYTHIVDARNFTSLDTKTGRKDIRNKTDEQEQEIKEKFLNSKIFRLLHNPNVSYRFVRILNPAPEKNQGNKTGGFFPYFLKEEVPFSLAKYGIYKLSEWKEIPEDKLNVNCLVECFKDTPHYENLKTMVFGTYSDRTKKKTFNQITNATGYKINVHCIQLNRKRVLSYDPTDVNKDTETFDIALYENHYFPLELTEFYTNYIKRCGLKTGNKRNYNCDGRLINSLNLVKAMFEECRESYFTPFQSEHFKSIYAQDIDKEIMFKDDFNTEKDTRTVKIPGKKMHHENVFLADIETTTDGDKHTPYLLCCEDEFGTRQMTFKGDRCVFDFLDYVSKFESRLIYFHNLGYDIKFIFQYLTNLETIEPTLSRCVYAKGNLKHENLTYHDFYEKMPAKLADFKDIF